MIGTKGQLVIFPNGRAVLSWPFQLTAEEAEPIKQAWKKWAESDGATLIVFPDIEIKVIDLEYIAGSLSVVAP